MKYYSMSKEHCVALGLEQHQHYIDPSPWPSLYTAHVPQSPAALSLLDMDAPISRTCVINRNVYGSVPRDGDHLSIENRLRLLPARPDGAYSRVAGASDSLTSQAAA